MKTEEKEPKHKESEEIDLEDAKSYKVLPFSPASMREALRNDYFTEKEVGEHPQARYIYQYLANPQMDATILLLEKEYTDRHYMDDFADYHVKCHREYGRVCRRLHFFSLREDAKESEKRGRAWTTDKFETALKRMVINAGDDTLKNAYLGFVVARPLPIAIIGRTMLRTYPVEGEFARRKFCTTENGNLNLFGVHWKVNSLACMEQDQTLAACATVALWTCFQKNAEVFHTPALSPTKITEMANEALQNARTIPSEGLTIDQVISAIQRNCLEAEVIEITNKTQLKLVLYAYLHYNLPVFLEVKCGNDRHALAISGYSLDKIKQKLEIEIQGEVENPIPFVSSRIDRFFAHDDNHGPYTKFSILRNNECFDKNGKIKKGFKSKGYENTQYALWRRPTSKKELDEETERWTPPEDEECTRYVPIVAVIPVYYRIRVSVKAMQQWIGILSVFIQKWVEGRLGKNNLGWDLRLTDQTEWKRDIEKVFPGREQQIFELRTEYQTKFIWRATLISGEENLMDLLADATDIGRDANPFYDVIFYDPWLEKIMSQMFSKNNLENKNNWTTQNQLDDFFYNYFSKYSFQME